MCIRDSLTAGQILQYNNAAITADRLVIRSSAYAGLSGTRSSINTLALASTGEMCIRDRPTTSCNCI